MHVPSITDTVVIPPCAHLYGMIVHEWRALMVECVRALTLRRRSGSLCLCVKVIN